MEALNHFLSALPQEDLERLRPHLEELALERDAVLGEAGRPVTTVFLPIDCILSVVTVMQDGSQVESRTIGREGGYGLLHSLGSRHAYERMTVQVSGRCWWLPVKALEEAAMERPSLVQHIVRHAQGTLLQSSLATACNALHPADQRLCRWLLMTQDRLGSDLIPLTQEHLAIMLGVQRTTVSAHAAHLKSRGMIRYARGKIRIQDRDALERCACECYSAMRRGVRAVIGSGKA